MSDRFQPTRAGVINVWDYVDEEWVFADGRLALRGHNGSGKTKALEVLFPFVLDGVADSRRLDPFSGENRTMKSNLLYRGQESEYGYVWMEFARSTSAETGSPETVTLIIGMRAHRNTDSVRMSFYVTSKRLGVDFGLLSADSRPLTDRQLKALLEPDTWRRTATEYRDLVDFRLFGLGRDRYAQLLDLLLALRRPLLAKDLDPAKVSDTLSSGLSPVDEYKAQGRIEDKRREMLAGAREVAGQLGRLERDRRQLAEAQQAAGKLSRRATAARTAEAKFSAELAYAAQRSGIADDGFGPVDSGDELLVTARARVAARRDDVGQIRRLLEAIRDAKAKRADAEQDLAALLATYIIARPDAEALAEALDHIGEPGATSITEVFDSRTAQRQAATIAARANLETGLREVRESLAAMRAQRDAIAAEQDDAPPASDLRPASREGRLGAPLWQLVRFPDGIADAEAAAVEGALYGAGLLTSWVHPDTALTAAALSAAEADGYLIPSVPVSGRTLADILVPEEQDHVAPATVTAVLRSIALTDDIGGVMVPAVSTKAQFTYGVHAGARPKATPEYIGATNRANRRRARLAEFDQLIARTVADEQQLAADHERAAELLEDCRRARRELPDTRPVAKAAEAVGTHAALLARARDEVAAARTAVDAAIAQVDAKTRQLRQAAAERRMPTAAEQVDAIARAAAEFEDAATQLHAERAKLAQAEDDLAEQTEAIDRRKLECAEAEEALAERERLQQALEEAFRPLQQPLPPHLPQPLHPT